MEKILCQFFRLSPEIVEDEIGASINNTYYAHGNHYHFSEAESIFDFTELLSAALKKIYDGLGEQHLEKNLFETSYKTLIEAIQEGYGEVKYNTPDFEFVRQLQSSAKWFAARKTALEVLQLLSLTMDTQKGTKRKFSEFKKLSKGIIGNYNITWLQTEYDTAIASARSARLWQEHVANADLYPNIEYLATLSAIPRESHRPYWGVIRPINDPFWDTHLPPLDFNCKCDHRSTDAKVKPLPTNVDTVAPVNPVLAINTGKTGLLFNLPATAYAKQTGMIPDAAIAKELKTRILPEMDFYIKAYEFPNGGSLSIHPGIDEKEWKDNVKYGSLLASQGHKIKLQPVTFDGKKNPDASMNDLVIDFKAPVTTKPDKMITNSVREAHEQGAMIVFIDVSKHPTNKADIWRGLRAATTREGKPHNENIQKVILMYDKNNVVELSREEILDYRALNKLKRD